MIKRVVTERGPRKVVVMGPMSTFVALLRGINVGTAKRVPMARRRAIFERLGYTDVATLLNSGNVVFASPKGG
jgi:uncharacterized protein (DUF1697 family)